VSHKPALEELLSKISTSTADSVGEETATVGAGKIDIIFIIILYLGSFFHIYKKLNFMFVTNKDYF